MINCPACGSPVEDNVPFCPFCGSVINPAPQQPDMGMTQYTQQPDMNMTQYGQPDIYGNPYPQQNVSQDPYAQPTTNADPYGQQGMYQDPYNQQMGMPYSNESVKKKSKKPLIITLSVLAIIAIAVVVLFPLGGLQKIRDKKAEKKLKQTTQEYIQALEDLNVEKIIKMSAPKQLIKDVLNDAISMLTAMDPYALDEILEYTSASSTDELMKQFDTYYDQAIAAAQVEINEYKRNYNINIDLNNTQITSVKPTSIKEIVHPFMSVAGGEMDGFINEDGIVQMIDNYGETYGVDFEHLYAIYVRTDVSLNGDGESYNYNADELYNLVNENLADAAKEMNLDLNFTDNQKGIRMFLGYEYEGEFYMIPDPEALLLPSLIKYMGKSRQSLDISNAHIITTAIQCALSYEDCYEYLTGEKAGQYIHFTESGLSTLDSHTKEVILENLDDEIPEISYTENGAKNFTFKVDSNGQVTVYISNGTTPDTWELYPDCDYFN